MPSNKKAVAVVEHRTARSKTLNPKSTAVALATEALCLTVTKTEARVDSRLLAQHLHNQHRPVIALIDKYLDRFEAMGKLLFQKAPSTDSRTGQRERYALLNEDQSFYLLALSRNTDRVVDLKLKLVLAFKQARQAAAVRDAEYTPTYHRLHDRIDALAAESPSRKFVHMNFNKLVNATAGIQAGQRRSAGLPQQSLLAVAQMVAARAVDGAQDHHDAYAKAKAALAALTGSVALLEVSA